MERLPKIAQFALPILLAAAAGLIKIRAGQLGASLILTMAGGALIGFSAAIVLESLLALLGHPIKTPLLSDRRLLQLEREKDMVLHSIKEIELDAALQKLESDEAARLIEPLRQRALILLRELDQAQLMKAPTVEEQIEQELACRLHGGQAGEGGSAK